MYGDECFYVLKLWLGIFDVYFNIKKMGENIKLEVCEEI